MQTVTYIANTQQGQQEVTIVPSQQILVIRALQQLNANDHIKEGELLPANLLDLIKQEIATFFSYGWKEDQFFPGANGEFWLSDRAIQAIIKECGENI